MLSSGVFRLIIGPDKPPFFIPMGVSNLRLPRCFAESWHSKQRALRMGCTSRAKLIFGRFPTGLSKENTGKEKLRREIIKTKKTVRLIKQESELQ